MRWFSHRRSRAREDRSRQNRMQAVNVHCRHPVTPGQPHSGLACCCVLRTACSACVALPCTVNGDDSAVLQFFVPGDLDLWPLTLTFELGRDFVQRTYPPSLIVLRLVGCHRADKQTNKHTHTHTHSDTQWHTLTNRQTPLKTFTSLRYATPVDNNIVYARDFTYFKYLTHNAVYGEERRRDR